MRTNENIQYLRGVAAISVVFAHTAASFADGRNIGGLANVVLHNLEMMGQVGVGVFFVISGYIMSMTTHGKVAGSSNAITFIFKRVVRIYPLYIFWTTVSVILWALHLFNSTQHYNLNKIITSYLLIPYSSFNGDHIDPILAQGWTLMYEMFFYLTFAILIFFGQHRKKGIYILALFFLIIEMSTGYMTSENAKSFFSFPIYFLFIIGMFIFHYQELILRYLKSRLSKVILLAVFFTLTMTILLNTSPIEENTFYLAYVASLPLFLYVFSAKKVSGTVLEIGNSSYSLYLTHIFSTTAYAIVITRYGISDVKAAALGIFVFLGAIAIGEMTYRLIEKRLIFKTANFVQISTKLKKS